MFMALLAALGSAATTAGSALASGAAATGSALASGASAAGSSLASGASAAGSAIAEGAGALGSAASNAAAPAIESTGSLIGDIGSVATDFGTGMINSNPITGAIGQKAGLANTTAQSGFAEQAGKVVGQMMQSDDEEVGIIPFADLMSRNLSNK